jgi:hypothetical protein
MRKMPDPSRENASVLPSRENAGWVADLLPVVICCSPVPSVRTRISWIGPVEPFGCAERTIQRAGAGAPAAVRPATAAISTSARTDTTRIGRRRECIAGSNITARRG